MGALVRGRLIEVLHRVNAPFLVPLLCGVGLAIFSLAKFITSLLATHPQPVWGFFTGLILASALVVARQVAGWGLAQWGLTALGAVIGYAITTLVPVETGVEGYKFALAGMVAICAMILPGISGSFLLVVMGKYQQVLTAVHEFDWGDLGSFWRWGGCWSAGLLAATQAFAEPLSRWYHGLVGGIDVGFPAQGVAVPQRAGGRALRMRVAAGV